MYQPTLGRFLSRDPLSANSQDLFPANDFFGERLLAMREHPYAYSRNSPVNYVDPSGLKCCVVDFKIDDAGVSALIHKPAMVEQIFAIFPQGARLGPHHGVLRAGPLQGRWFVGRSYDLTIIITSDSNSEDCDIKRTRTTRTDAYPWGDDNNDEPMADGPNELTILRTPYAIYMHDSPGHTFYLTLQPGLPRSFAPALLNGEQYRMGANYEIVVTDKTGGVSGEAKVGVFVHISYTKGRGFHSTGNMSSLFSEEVHEDCCSSD